MRMLAVGLVLVAGVAQAARAASIEGDYVEARTADVFTGPCFSNAEIFITGNQAVMAWKIRKGSFKGVDLSGLCVAAAVRATTTLSEDQPERAQSVLIVDARASERQGQALIALAQRLGGERLARSSKILRARMSLKLEDHVEPSSGHHMYGMPHSPRASFWAAGIAQIVTRPLDDRDHACGNEVVAYPPLSQGVEVAPAYTLSHSFKGLGLDAQWADPNARSSFVGRFAF